MIRTYTKRLQSLPRQLYRISRCLGCQQPTHHSSLWCKDCLSLLQPVATERCQQCGIAIPHPPRCGQCLKRPPAFDLCIVFDDYQWPLDKLIQRFKHHKEVLLGQGLAELFYRHHSAAAATTLCPVPMHWRKQWQRGFNQSELLCQSLAKFYHLPHMDLFSRKHAGHDLIGLSRSERQRAIRNSYQLKPFKSLPSHITLVDDVMTTGATLNELANQLKKAGVEQINCWVLARTPKPYSTAR
ncbi:MAG: hypothetical protein CENE_01955 [Candidatus Celerinatantimonas neptuna]|nr:MAG: hypothetical protein CENE_01955 [Candidatus Celerinatantimonas neptuna]